MITVKEIDQLVKYPEDISQSHLIDLKSLSEKYPYSQVFSILYLKGLKRNGDFHFDDELAKQSYRITDRVQLYNLIEDNTNESAITRKASTSQAGENTKQSNELGSGASENTQTDFPLEKNRGDKSVDDVASSEKTTDAVDENILHHAISISYQLDDLTESEEEGLAKRKTNNEDQKIAVDGDKTNQEDESKQIGNSKHSFASWLKANNNYEEDTGEDLKYIKSIVTNFENFDPSDDLFGEIEKPKVEFFSPSKKAKESLDDSAVPVSETLAKIYALQGNYPKAIEAYEQLSLINPEKKIFFADQIKELKKKIHSK